MSTLHDGAWSEPKPATAETQGIADKVKSSMTLNVTNHQR